MTIIAQFIGFLFFIIIAISGFWCLSFLLAIVPYWVIMGTAETYEKINASILPEKVCRKILPKQENVKLLWRKP